MRIASSGHAVFAVTIIALGILGLIKGDFNVWQPLSGGGPARAVLAYLCAFTSVLSGIGLLWGRTAAPAARVLLALVLTWLLVFRAPGLLHGLTVDVYWSLSQTGVLLAAA